MSTTPRTPTTRTPATMTRPADTAPRTEAREAVSRPVPALPASVLADPMALRGDRMPRDARVAQGEAFLGMAYPTTETFLTARWEEWAPVYDRLETIAVDPAVPGAVESWLHAWAAMDLLADDAASRWSVAAAADTTNDAAGAACERMEAVFAARAPIMERLQARWRSFGVVPAGFEREFALSEAESAVYRDENIARSEADGNAGHQTIERLSAITLPGSLWGEDAPRPLGDGIERAESALDRGDREVAWRAVAAAVSEARADLAQMMTDRIVRRTTIATAAGFEDFRSYHWAANSEAVPVASLYAFHDAVARHVVPLATAREASRARELGLDRVRPWDLGALRPSEIALATACAEWPRTVAVVTAAARAWDPAVAEVLETMIARGYLDGEARTGKAEGAFCERFPVTRAPLIVMNAIGDASDLITLAHELGHAYHAALDEAQPTIWHQDPPMEVAEVASQTLELLVLDAIAAGAGESYGFPASLGVVLMRRHLEEVLRGLCHIATIDAFMHRCYTEPALAEDAEARDVAWVACQARFDVGTDWSGLAHERTLRWYRQSHFVDGWYYFQYGVAQLAALELWAAARAHPAAMRARFDAALRLGNAVDPADVYATAGISLTVNEAAVQTAVAAIRAQLETLDAVIAHADR